ncbi:hypothetical protein GCM10009574_096760 [Streptomyces asiaticus]|uniref:Uncharacterized protein n=2 Tax=Streptomyces rhizosphaericus TaxID=114699 RepID=A0ABN1SPY5_9ACTN
MDALCDGELVAEHQDRNVFRRARPGQQREPSEGLAPEQIDQTYCHDPASCPHGFVSRCPLLAPGWGMAGAGRAAPGSWLGRHDLVADRMGTGRQSGAYGYFAPGVIDRSWHEATRSRSVKSQPAALLAV